MSDSQVSRGVKCAAAQCININDPTTTVVFGAAGLKTPAAGENGPPSPISPHCNMGQACLRSHRLALHIIDSAGQFPHTMIACNTHPGWGALACACICRVKLPPLEVRRPRGKGRAQKQSFKTLPSENQQQQTLSPALLIWLHLIDVLQEREKLSPLDLHPTGAFDIHAWLLDK